MAAFLFGSSDSTLCSLLNKVPIQTPITEMHIDSIGERVKMVPPPWGNPWYTFSYRNGNREISLSGAVQLYGIDSSFDLLFNGAFWIISGSHECGCEYVGGERKCVSWQVRRVP